MSVQAWYRVELSPEECVKNGKADQLQRAFDVMFVSMRQPVGAALFEWFDERLETNVFYFSPEAAILLRGLIGQFGGVECAPPLPSHWLLFLAGDDRVSGGLERLAGDRR